MTTVIERHLARAFNRIWWLLLLRGLAFRLRKEVEGEIFLILAGLLSVVFGVLLVVQPAAGALTLVWLIASYAVAFGVLLIILAFKARGFARHIIES